MDKFLLALTAVAVLGLSAWRWELAGGVFTIAMLFGREIAWVVRVLGWWRSFFSGR